MLTSVKFRLTYNEETKAYDVDMLLMCGSIKAGREQQVYNQHITLIVPVGVKLPKMIPANEPRQGNFIPATQLVERGKANVWNNSTVRLNAKSGLGYDLYSYNTSVSGAWWPVATQHSVIRLFSIPFEAPKEGLRLWENNMIRDKRKKGDPSSSDPRTGGNDFNNGMNMPYHEGDNWSFREVYNGNVL